MPARFDGWEHSHETDESFNLPMNLLGAPASRWRVALHWKHQLAAETPALPGSCSKLVLPLLVAMGLGAGAAEATAPIRFAGAPAELVISEISERTLRVTLSPLDEHER